MSEHECYRLLPDHPVEVKVQWRGKRTSAQLCELSGDRAVVEMPLAPEIADVVTLHLRCRDPEAKIVADGPVLWVRYTSDGQWRVVFDFRDSLASEQLAALRGEGMLGRRVPSTRRLPLETVAQWEMELEKMQGFVTGFNAQGFAFLASRPPRNGDRLLLLLSHAGSEPLQIPARAQSHWRCANGHLVQCSYETARGYELLGSYLYPPEPVKYKPHVFIPHLSLRAQVGVLIVLFVHWVLLAV